MESDLVRLIDRYRRIPQAKRDSITEQETGTKFVLPLLRALGWDVENVDEVRERHRTASGPSDYELLINGMPRVVVEVKKIANSLDGHYVSRGRKVSYPTQAIQYAWNIGAEWAVLTNFKELRLYHSLSKDPESGLVLGMSVSDMPHRLDDLALLTRESILEGRLDALNLRKDRKEVDRQVIDDLDAIRRGIHGDILRNNKEADIGGDLRTMVQILMNRLLVIRVAEDRGLVSADTLRSEVSNWRKRGLDTPFARWLRVLFADFEEIYDTELFRAGAIDKVALSNSLLTEAADRLYRYDFALIGSDVLGSICEDYLATSLQDEGRRKLQAAGDDNERKKLGIYYTPPHLVSHILDKTLGARLAGCKTPEEVSKIRVLDPSCGSGSFLIKAFDLFLDWYREYNRAASMKIAASARRGVPGKTRDGGNGTLDGDLAAVTDPEHRIIRDNLFGIDVDPQAAGIASVNLMLKAMAKNERLDRILGTNILVGNSLVTGLEEGFGGMDPDDQKGLRPLDPARLPHARFDVVVGNPPYCAVGRDNPIRISSSFERVKSGSAVNAAMMFVERSIELLSDDDGRLGLVIPKMCSYAKGWSRTRGLLAGSMRLTHVVDCTEAFKDVNLEQVVVIGKKPAEPDGGGGACLIQRAEPGAVQGGEAIDLSVFADNGMIFLESDPASWSIREKMLAGGRLLGDLLDDGAITTGEYAQGLDCWPASRPDGGRRMLSGDDIARYRITASRYYKRDEPLMAAGTGGKAGAVQAPHVVGQRIVAHRGDPRPHIALAFAYDGEGSRAFDTVTHVMPGGRIDAHALVAILNSRPVSWYAHRFVFCNAVRSMDLRPWYMGKVVVPAVSAADERALAALEREISRLARSRHAKRPSIRDYLTESEAGTMPLREHVRAASGRDRRLHGKAVVGRASRIKAVDAGGGWLDFFADYVPPRMRAPRHGKALSLRIPNRGMRDFVRLSVRGGAAGAQRAGQGERVESLYEQVARVRIPAYGRGFAESQRALGSMLAPYAADMERFESWNERFAEIDAKIDGIVCRAFGLSAAEARHINASSLPPGWSNY